MSGMTVQAWIRVDGADRFGRLGKRLKEAGRGDLKRELTRAVRKEGAPALAAVKAAWGGVDITPPAGSTGQSTGLRARVAAATTIQVRATAIRIAVNPSRVDPVHGDTLARGVNGVTWHHPLYGNRRHWYRSKGQEVFYSTLSGFEDRWRAGIEDAMEKVAREIAG